MAEIKGIAHFSIPVSDVDKSTRFYTEIVGCKFLSALPDKSITFSRRRPPPTATVCPT